MVTFSVFVGRCGDYGLASMGGKPVQCVQHQRFRQGYAKVVAEQGYQQVSARPWQESESCWETAGPEQAAAASQRNTSRAACPRCILFFVLGQDRSRGVNIGAWRVVNVKLMSGVPGIL